MKSVNPDSLDGLPGRRLADGETFLFRCHPGISCFNRCCRNLNLFLYPYDVVQLKQSLGIDSDSFLEQHADIVLREGNYFPDVLLRMSENTERTCPFLSLAGCRVYSHRPDACRTFPLEQGAFQEAATGKSRLVHFFRPPDFCKGQQEDTPWTVKSWADDQEALEYHRMTLLWSDLKRRFAVDPWNGKGPESQAGKMAFMATYNIDRFREFVFGSSFLKKYKIKSTLLKKLRKDDPVLMKFGFQWVALFLWRIPTRNIRLR